MENLKSHKQTMALFDMYENEFRILCSSHDTLQQVNAEMKLQYKKKLTAERKKKVALSQEIDKLKKKLNSMSDSKVTSETMVSSSAMEAPGQNLEVKGSAEYQALAAELERERRNREVLSQKITELNHQFQIERELRAKAEAEAGEAVDIADQLVQMHNSSDEPLVTTQMLNAELEAKVEGLHLEILELNQSLQEEKELRAQAEADKFKAAEVAKALCKQVEEAMRFSDNALQKLNKVEKSIKDVANKYEAEKTEKESLQQEIVELLQKQNDLRDQNETDSLRDFEILEAQVAELKRVSEDQSAERQALATRLEMEEKKQKDLCHNILWLIEMLEKEMESRTVAETDKLEAIEVGEALCQKLEKCKVCSTSQGSEAKSAAKTVTKPAN